MEKKYSGRYKYHFAAMGTKEENNFPIKSLRPDEGLSPAEIENKLQSWLKEINELKYKKNSLNKEEYEHLQELVKKFNALNNTQKDKYANQVVGNFYNVGEDGGEEKWIS